MAQTRRWPVLAGVLGLAGCALDSQPVHGYDYRPAPTYGYVEPYGGYGRPYGSYSPARERVYSPPPVAAGPDRRRDGNRGHDGRREQRDQSDRQPSAARGGVLDYERPRVLDRRSPADRGDLGG